MIYAKIGTVSHGTLRTEDLIEAFSDALQAIAIKNGDELDHAALETACQNWLDESEEDRDDESGSELVEDLRQALEAYAPPYCYFGNTDGDGSDFGFWPSMDSLEEAARDGDVLKLDAGDEIPAGETRPVMFVSDHGNVTLMVPEVRHVEAWSIV